MRTKPGAQIDPRNELQRRFGVALHERSVGKILAELGCTAPPPKADEEVPVALNNAATWAKRGKRPCAPHDSTTIGLPVRRCLHNHRVHQRMRSPKN